MNFDDTNTSSHEGNINKQINTINTIRNSYSTNYTVHGMAKIFHGLLWEKILWLIVLLSCFGTVFYFTYGFYIEFSAHNIRTEFRLKSLKEVTLPTITLCTNHPLEIHAMCYKNRPLGWGRNCTYNVVPIPGVCSCSTVHECKEDDSCRV